MKTLFIVDVQNDFCPGGALEAPTGDQVIPVLNKIMDYFDLVLASKDWHPEDTKHFEKWPVHCVQESKGAEFHPDLNADHINKVFYKGTSKEDDGYSAFEATNDDLEEFLKNNGVETLYVGGLATDYCVVNTVLDAQKRGFQVEVIEDAIRGVDVNEGDVAKAKQQMKDAGAEFVQSVEIIEEASHA